MIGISWSQFERNQLAKDISFESFCFQVAFIQFKEYGFFENFYNTPGSEFYLTIQKDCPELNLKAGNEVGWQVKWWINREENSPLDAGHRDKLIENFTTTLKAHPTIKQWIICTPGAFREPEFKKLKLELKKLSSNTEYIHWNKESFENFHTAKYEKLGNVFHHYFNSIFIGFDFIKQYSQRRIDDLKTKFDTELYTPSHYDDEILSIIDYKSIFAELEDHIKYLKDDIDKIEKDELYNDTDYKPFTKEYISKAYELLYLTVNTSKTAIEFISSKMSIEKTKLLYTQLQIHHNDYRALADFLNKKINTKEHLLKGHDEDQTANWKHNNYLIESINNIQRQLMSDPDEENNKDSILTLVVKALQKDIHILSSAGYGKTNIACNICNSCLINSIPCFLFLGSSFRKIDLPQTMFLEQLGLCDKYTFKELLQSLNTLGFTKGVKVPIIIDGLNESKPYDEIWRSNIKEIIREIYELDNIILITTCRDRYIESIFEETDVSKIPNTKILVGLDEKQRLNAIPKYFQKYNIVPSSWNFSKDLFRNPLLLKIFSEVNANKKNIRISLDNIFNSIDSYVNLIEKKVSKVNSSVDPIVQRTIKSNIANFCRSLWVNKKREVSITEFHNIIDPTSTSLIGSLTEKLLDEGLCFQKNLATESETVQFTYDLVGGYCIASKVLLESIPSKEDIVITLKELGIEERLFNKNLEHPLKQDILISLSHLLFKKFQVHLFEFFENEVVIEECFNSIDYFIGKEAAQEKLLQYISKGYKNKYKHRLLFEKLFENSFKKEIHGLGDFTIKVLQYLNQSELDIFWTELIRKNRNTVYQVLYKINKAYLRNKNENNNPEEDLVLSFLSTMSSDKSIRNIATENLFLISKKHPDKILLLAKQIIPFNDINAIESVILAICGSVLVLKNIKYTSNSLEYIVNEFLPAFFNTHICIIDYIHTISEFAYYNFKIDYSKRILFNKNPVKISKNKEVTAKLGNDYSVHFPFLFGLDLYDFNKHQISGISYDGYRKRSTLSSVECLAILSDSIIHKGYDESLFEAINKEIHDDSRYKYGRGSNDNLTVYQEKYLWQSYYELVGYLVLNNKLKSEDKIRFRCDYNFFDPTFPRLPQRFQLILECFFPQANESVQKWINSKKQDFLDDIIIQNLNTNSEWILLSADLTQEGQENDTRFNLSLESLLIPKKEISFFKKEYEKGNHHNEPRSFYNTYAGEINWSKFVKKREIGYYEENLGFIDILYEYTWPGWTNNRYQNPYFKFLNPSLSNLERLTFNVEDLSFYNKDYQQITKIIWTENAKLYYIKKNTIDEIINKLNLELVWHQFISKYGEFGKHQNHTLNPNYKDLRRIIIYKDITKKK